MSSGTAVFTIIAKNYLPYARVLMSSVAFHHPDWRRFVILVDAADGYFDARWENFEVVPSETMGCTEFKWFKFKYSILELSTAIKPDAFKHLFQQHDFSNVIYLDPDIKVYSKLDKVSNALKSSNLVLIPHLTRPINDEKLPGELQILRSGTYNLGFLAAVNSPTVKLFLDWWQEKLYDQCVVDLAQGLFVDQRWIDLVPGLFERVSILRDSGFNVAYWNLSHRAIVRAEAGIEVNGSPLVFFHFSGYDPSLPSEVSRHQNRHIMGDLPPATQQIFRSYGQDLMAAGYLGCRNWPYSFATFDNGTPIPDFCRPIHHEVPGIVNSVHDPFSDSGFEVFVRIWNSPQRDVFPGISKFAYRIYQSRTDVRAHMPDIFGRDYGTFLKWMLESAANEHRIPSIFLNPVSSALSAFERQQELPVPEHQAKPIPQQTPPWWTETVSSIYQSRPEIQHRFRDPLAADQGIFIAWLLTYGKMEHGLTTEQLDPAVRQWHLLVTALPGAIHRFRCDLSLRRKTVWAITRSLFVRRTLSDLTTERKSIAGATTSTILNLSQSIQSATSHDSGTNVAGVNLVGYFRTETGVGQSARNAYASLVAASVPVSLVCAGDSNSSRKEDFTLGPLSESALHIVNLFHVNADQTEAVKKLIGDTFYEDRLNIGYWAWELEDFPDCWQNAFSTYAEIWTPSTFCREAVGRKSPVPTFCVPHSVAPSAPQGIGRESLGLAPDRFIFLTALDVLSVMERKNPLAVIKAFQLAFDGDSRYELVVKVNNAPAGRDAVQKLRNACLSSSVRIIDATLRREEMYALSQNVDCFVSLHRSEGFGLLIAESMYFGKPVVVTNYSGNMDFTRPENSFLVDYKLIPVGTGCGPYSPFSRWADPNIEHAAEQMKTVATNHELRLSVARAGKEFIYRAFSPEAVGRTMRRRFSVLQSQAKRKLVAKASTSGDNVLFKASSAR